MKTLVFIMFGMALSGCGQDSDYVVNPKKGTVYVESFSPCGSSGTQSCETSDVTIDHGVITKVHQMTPESYGDVDAMVAEGSDQ